MRAHSFQVMCGVIAAAMLAPVAGCEMFKGEGTARRNNANQATGDHWQIHPVRVRVYPSTRFVVYENQVALEARIEFLDDMGDPLKAVGTFRFEVFAANRDGEVIDRDRLFSWKIQMLSKEENVEYYDAVTRAYLFRLGVDRLPGNVERVVLLVSFEPPGAERLSTQAVIQVR